MMRDFVSKVSVLVRQGVVLLLLVGWMGPLAVLAVSLSAALVSADSSSAAEAMSANGRLLWLSGPIFVVHWLSEFYYVQHAGRFAGSVEQRRRWQLLLLVVAPIAVAWLSVQQITGHRTAGPAQAQARTPAPPDLLSDCLKHWRLGLAALASQAVGGALGVVVSFHYVLFVNFWLGAVLATPIGFVIGLLWQYSDAERHLSIPLYPAVFLGVIVVVLAAFGGFVELPRMAREMKLIRSLRQLEASDIRRIEILDKYGEEKLATIEAGPVVADFALACHDVEGYLPNHPLYIAEWYVKLVGTFPDELVCSYERDHPGEVIGTFVTRWGPATYYHGSFRSRRLRSWFEEHAPDPARRR